MPTVLRQSVVFAARYLRRHPSFACGGTLIVALGITFSAGIFAVVKGALIAPWPYRGYDRIVTTAASYPLQGRTAYSLWSAPEIDDMRRSGLFEGVIAGDARNMNLSHAGTPERVPAAVITPNVFALLGARAFMGRMLDEQDAAPGAPAVAVISYALWKNRLGGDPSAVGKPLQFSDAARTVVGVMPPTFVFWGRDVWMPLHLDPTDARTDRRYYVQAMLPVGTAPDAASRALSALMQRWAVDHADVREYAGATAVLTPLVDDVLRDLRPVLYLLLGAVGLLLLVAAANLANAMLAQGLAREGELALRRALGASAAGVSLQLVMEGVALGVGGALVAIPLTVALLPRMVALVPFGYIPAEATVAVDWFVTLAAAGGAIVVGALVGCVPALRAAAIDPGRLIKQSGSRSVSAATHRSRAFFASVQIAMAVALIAGALTIAGAMRAQLRRNPGFSADDVWLARVALASADAARQSGALTFERILDRVRQIPGVQQAALSSASPTDVLPRRLVSAPGADPSPIDADVLAVTPSFFRTLAVPITQGRAFSDDDRANSASVVIVSRALADRLQLPHGVIGAQLAWSGGAATIVGVAGDIDPFASTRRARPLVMHPLAQQPPVSAVIEINTTRDDVSKPVAAAVASVDAAIPVFGQMSLAQARVDVLGAQRLAGLLMGAFALAVLALSAVGLYAVMSHSVREREREMGIRLTLGAAPSTVFAAECVRALRLLIPGSVLGLAIAAAGGRWASSVLPNTQGSMVEPLAIAAGVVLALGLIAASVPARRAANADLLRAIRGQ